VSKFCNYGVIIL